VTLTINDRVVAPAREVRELVEPGKVDIVASAPGRPRFARTREVAAGDTLRIELFVDDDAAEPREPPHVATDVLPATPPPDDHPAAAPRRPGRVHLAIGLGATATVAFATSIVIGLEARAHYNTAKTACGSTADPPVCRDPELTQLRDAVHLSKIGTGVAIGASVVGLAGAIVYLTAPHDLVVSPSASARSAGLTISGRF
jgi:hypothetical protein